MMRANNHALLLAVHGSGRSSRRMGGLLRTGLASEAAPSETVPWDACRACGEEGGETGPEGVPGVYEVRNVQVRL